MPENPTEPTEPHDVRTIHQLVRMMKRYDLTAIDFIEGETKIRLRRRGSDPAAGASSVPAAAPSPAMVTAAAPRAEPAPQAGTAAATGVVIESPMVGTYFSSSAPDAPPFVSVGSVVHAETIVCIIEAMKVFTDIPVGVSGTIAAILVKSGQAVEFGQPLFRLIPS